MSDLTCSINIYKRIVTVTWMMDATVEVDQKPDWAANNYEAFRKAFRECEGGLIHSANVAIENRVISVFNERGLNACRDRTGMVVRYAASVEV